MKFIVKLIINALAVLISASIIPGVKTDGFLSAFIASVVLGIANTIVKPLLILFTLPLTILTLGLFILVINAFMILLTAYFVPGFHVDGFIAALIFSIVLSIVSSLLEWLTE